MIIDRYGEHFVLQTLTLAMDMRKELIVEAMTAVLGATSHHRAQRCASPSRGRNGIAQTGILFGEAPSEVEIEVAGLQIADRSAACAKDRILSRPNAELCDSSRRCEGRRVLDCFTSQGAFALACARAGASEVTAVEASAENIEIARKKCSSAMALRSAGSQDDVFNFSRGAEKRKREYDLIMLDPPSFTKTKGGLHDAMRGYHELHVRAFKLLSHDGLLATFSCSHHVSAEVFD